MGHQDGAGPARPARAALFDVRELKPIGLGLAVAVAVAAMVVRVVLVPATMEVLRGANGGSPLARPPPPPVQRRREGSAAEA